jgi:tetratricopeptide (TPR) repeat protein
MEQIAKATSSLNLGEGDSSSSTTTKSGPSSEMDITSMLPELPPGRRAAPNYSGMTLEETVADLKTHPLFMTELSEADAEENEELAALQALAYEGTPRENAANFREQGNECFRERRWADAREFYGKGIVILLGEERRRARGERRKVKREGKKKGGLVIGEVEAGTSAAGPDLNEEEQKQEEFEEVDDDPAEVAAEQALLETLSVNRAACHLELRNFRSCTLDCAAALRLNPRNLKALYRSVRALLAVNKLAEADDACARGLAIDPSNKPLQQLTQDIARAREQDEARRQREEERLAKERRREALLRTALQARGIVTRTTPGRRPPDMEDARVMLAPDELDPASGLVFPTMLLYPCHMESDFIKAFSERESLEQHFGYVFPLPWDKTGEYGVGSVECYVEGAKEGALVKVGKKVPLLKVLGGGNVPVVDGLLKVFVVPRARAEAWVREWKEMKAKQSGQ